MAILAHEATSDDWTSHALLLRCCLLITRRHARRANSLCVEDTRQAVSRGDDRDGALLLCSRRATRTGETAFNRPHVETVPMLFCFVSCKSSRGRARARVSHARAESSRVRDLHSQCVRTVQEGGCGRRPHLIPYRVDRPCGTAFMRRLCLAAAAAFSHAAFRLPPAPTVASALRMATAAFHDGLVPEAALSAEHLLARAAGFGNDRAALGRNGQDVLSIEAKLEFEQMCALRLKRTPVQYILGDWDFHQLTLALRAPVLIPRPETEELVEHVLKSHARPERETEAARTILDVGCGSGAIGLALLHSLRDSSCVAIDVSAEAVALATENAVRCGLDTRYNAQLVPGGIAAYGAIVGSDQGAEDESTGTGAHPPCFDVIVSNPPYIPRVDMLTLEREVVGYEDDRALCGGDDGLDVVRELLRVAPRLLRPEGPRAIWLEVDTSHPPLIEEWLAREPQASELRLEFTQWLADGYGRPRFCEVRWKGPKR